MKKALLIFVVLAALCVPGVSAVLTPVSCDNWYLFGSVRFPGLITDRPVYSGGETIIITSRVSNDNTIPIVGDVRAKVIYAADNVSDYVLDEFFLARGVSLLPNETLQVSGEWTLPANAKSGNYKVGLFFISADGFNLGGVSFMNKVYGGATGFEVSGGSDLLYFDTEGITMNGRPQPLSQPIGDAFERSKAIKVDMPIMNEGSPVQADLKYELYSWDDLKAEDLLDQKQEMAPLGSGGSKMLSYTLPATLPAGAYLLKITAESQKNKAIAKIRVPIGGSSIKLNFAGIDRFPVADGQPVTMFLCVSNTAESTFRYYASDSDMATSGNIKAGSVKISVEADGKELTKDSASGLSVNAYMQGYQATFTPDANYRTVVVKASAEDEAGTKDSAELTYDFAKFLRKVDIKLDAYAENDVVTASVKLSTLGQPFKSHISLFVTGEDQKSVFYDSADVDGTYSNTFRLPNGEYVVSVVEAMTRSSANKTLSVSYVPPPPKPEGQPFDSTPLVLILLAAIVVLGLFVAKRKGALDGVLRALKLKGTPQQVPRKKKK